MKIMCGMGKTGTMHAWQQEGIRGPDLQMIGKALGGGFLPLSAVLVHQKIFDTLVQGSGGLAHGHTFQVRVSQINTFNLGTDIGSYRLIPLPALLLSRCNRSSPKKTYSTMSRRWEAYSNECFKNKSCHYLW